MAIGPDVHPGLVRMQAWPLGWLLRTPGGRKRRSDPRRTASQCPEGVDAQLQRAKSMVVSADGHLPENAAVGGGGRQPGKGTKSTSRARPAPRRCATSRA